MISLRQCVVSILPGSLYSVLRPWWRRLFRFRRRAREWWMPFIMWVMWLVFQCIRRRKRAVIVCRFGGIGDVLCILPMCDEVRHRHPGKLLVFMTAAIWQEVVVISRSADLVYANKWWVHPRTLPTNIKLFGLVDAIYNPKTTYEQVHNAGMRRHLADDFAASCGFALTTRQTKLYPSPDLIKETCIAYGLDNKPTVQRLLIGINPGPNWRVKEWEASKWQKLINKIHSEYNAVIIQFGFNTGDGSSEYDNLTGVKLLAGRLKGEELLALVSVCDLIISIDSGPVHLAGAVRTPVIGLFGPLDPALILPPDAHALGLFSDVPCLFCHNRTPVIHWCDGCPNDIACMKKLSCDEVFEAAKSMLPQKKNSEIEESFAVFD
jgi:ADP-heptose:LPS heptosyltransferase